MESESRMNNDEAVLFQEQDLNKTESSVQSPNFESRETFTAEDNFDDNCSSTTGASGCRDNSVSPQRFSGIEHDAGARNTSISRANHIEIEFRGSDPYNNSDDNVVNFNVNTMESVKNNSSNNDIKPLDTMINVSNIELINAKHDENIDKSSSGPNISNIMDDGSSSTEFLSRQRALDRANVFLRWNLAPSKQQVAEFLEMAQGKLNLSMVSEKGYDYCLLYFELLRDGLINGNLWRETTVEELLSAINEARQTLNGDVTPPQNIKKRRVNNTLHDDNSSSYNSKNIENGKIPLHVLTKVTKHNPEFDDTNSELQETPVNYFGLERNNRCDETDDRQVDNENIDNSFNSLEWQGVNSTSSKASDISVESSCLNLNKDTAADSNRGGSDSDDTGDNIQDNEGNISSKQDAMNRLLNPKSGCKGVSWSNRQMAWLAFWKEDNQRRSKTFSARKLGFEEAQRRAIEFLRRKREEVRMKTQAHLYEELPRVGTASINSSGDNAGIKTPSRRNYSNSNATTTATPATPVTPSLDLEQYSNTMHQFIPGFDDSSRNLMSGAGSIFNTTGNILPNNIPSIINHGNGIQQNMIQSNVGQPGILTAAAAAAAQQMGLPFHLAAISSMAGGGIPIDPAISATVAAATGMNIGVQAPPQNQANSINGFTHAALMAANPFFMFGAAAAAAAAAAVGSGNSNVGSSHSGSHFPWQQFQNGGIGSLVQNPMQVDRREMSLSMPTNNSFSIYPPEMRSGAKGDSSEFNTHSSIERVDKHNEGGDKTLICEPKVEAIVNDVTESLTDNIKSIPKIEDGAGSITAL
ncbi:hypothetical protein OJ253_599 [Cryptosporidium canis]|uniref:AP2/ERF domain-containing protein n=1 Tax=Cryptosporidium canis TaxID=195482 RepID=A0A9D5HYQ6_9CRYT|nr:hypothetical protein OJ253_599 [Cryptosporidium canis]